MSELAVDGRFGCIFVAFRSFQHLLTIDLQRRTRAAVQRHLAADGRLALHLFDPRLDLLIDGNLRPPTLFGVEPTTQRRYVGEVSAHQLRSCGADSSRSLAVHGVRRGWRVAGTGYPRDVAPLDLALGTAPPAGAVRFRGGSGLQRLRGIGPLVWQGTDRGGGRRPPEAKRTRAARSRNSSRQVQWAKSADAK